MDFPRHLNPARDTRLVSRADLEASNDVEDPQEHEELEAHLHETLRSRFKRSLEVGDTGTQTKRRKVSDVDAESPSTAVEFRLISSSLPPREILLGPKPPRIIKVKEPECEDTEEQSQRRLAQAQAIAVDFDWIMEEAAKPNNNTRGKVMHVAADLPHQTPVIMVAERENPIQHPSRFPQSQPSPHALPDGLCCPVIPITEGSDPPKKKRKRCPKLKSKSGQTQSRPQPQFWRPEAVWRGYAYGYPMSWPISQGGLKSGYCRDTMRKATFEL